MSNVHTPPLHPAASALTAKSDLADLAACLEHLTEHLSHVLPAQAPLKDFVHHNTLHGFQHLPFAEAIQAVHELTGQSGWMPETRMREFFAAGRINAADLTHAVAETGLLKEYENAAEHLVERQETSVPWSSSELLVASLLSEFTPPSAAQWAWHTQAAATDPPHFLRQATWQVAKQLSQINVPIASHTPNAPNTATPAANLSETWQAASTQIWADLQRDLGHKHTLSVALARLSGEQVRQKVREPLIRHLAAYLDRGTAAWFNPERHQGFYAAWKASAVLDPAWDLEELSDAAQHLAALPADALSALAAELAALELAPAQWADYLETLCLELPGWSGMMLWHHHQPQSLSDRVVHLTDYLVVRLVLNRLYLSELCHRLWQIPLAVSALANYFTAHPAELWVRWQLYAAGTPWADGFLHQAQNLVRRSQSLETPLPDSEWASLAEAMWQARQSSALSATPVSDPNANLDPNANPNVAWGYFVLLHELVQLNPSYLVYIKKLAEEERPSCLLVLKNDLVYAQRLNIAQRGLAWLTAYERHYREQIFTALAANHGRYTPAASLPSAQAIFCMDDREEGSRRHLEEVDPRIVTYGAAGFFGLPIYWQSFDGTQREALCPVVVKPSNELRELPLPGQETAAKEHLRRRAWRRRWREALHQESRRGLFLGPMLTSLAAPLALATLLVDTLAPAGWANFLRQRRRRFDLPVKNRLAVTAPSDSPAGTPEQPRLGFTLEEQVARVAAFLSTIGLTKDFAPLVVFMGHGSGSRNNPHLSAYDCGACSGRHGGANARAFATIANRPEVRAGLATRGIVIPASTWFVAAEHNTCDEAVVWYDRDLLPPALHPAFAEFCTALDTALARHAVERCRRLASAPLGLSPDAALRHVAHRRHDAAQARPELGHATNACALIGRRDLSRGAFFDRRAFLISYDPSSDPAGTVLENLLLAAGPVGAGISLEYYFSTVNNGYFGSGSKITHNLTGFFAVMDGASSDLRTGLPRQMIEIHEAMRLLVVVEHELEVLTAIYQRQPPLQELIGKGWITLAAKSPNAAAIHFFNPNTGWEEWQTQAQSQSAAPIPTVPNSLAWCSHQREALSPALVGEAN